MTEVGRRAEKIAIELLAGFRALVVNGPRQAGKSTLVQRIQSGRGDVFNLDDAALLDRAVNDPTGFLAQLPESVAIDEFQRGGDPLLLALKVRVDGSREPGQYLLAGSTRFLTTRRLSETMTGRVGILDLLPLSAGEIRGVRETFIERAFEGGSELGIGAERIDRVEYAQMIAAGGFPELVLGSHAQRFRTAWCDSYVQTVTAVANLEQVAEVRRPRAMIDLLGQAAARSAGEVVHSDLAREVVVDEGTIRSYLDVLSTLYLLRLHPAWSTSSTNRAKKRPKLHFVDTALAAHLIGVTGDQLAELDSPWFGPLLESYVAAELSKQASWSERPVKLSHYRDRDQREVDLILERGREIVGIEVKASASPTARHAKHLAYLRDRLGARFKSGIVLHTGTHVTPLGDRLIAVPVSALWAS
ncbi:MAG: ATP-binding protein [Acidimicrobiia bacterium]